MCHSIDILPSLRYTVIKQTEVAQRKRVFDMRRTRLFNVIAIATFLSLLLPLLVGCSSQYETASATIPDGWEAVSTSGKVTHLRLKEGSDAYHYMEINQRSFRGSYKFLDMEIAGNSENRAIRPDENGNIYVILYYGHMWMKYDQATDQYVMSEPPAPEDDKLYRINMSYIPDAGYPHHLAELGQLDAENSLTLESLSSEQDGVRIGFSNAIMVPIHVSELNGMGLSLFQYSELLTVGRYGQPRCRLFSFYVLRGIL